ncbi:MAG: hypothetical protein ACYC96_06415 [Fimbriimonadaceae bacterium]
MASGGAEALISIADLRVERDFQSVNLRSVELAGCRSVTGRVQVDCLVGESLIAGDDRVQLAGRIRRRELLESLENCLRPNLRRDRVSVYGPDLLRLGDPPHHQRTHAVGFTPQPGDEDLALPGAIGSSLYEEDSGGDGDGHNQTQSGNSQRLSAIARAAVSFGWRGNGWAHEKGIADH